MPAMDAESLPAPASELSPAPKQTVAFVSSPEVNPVSVFEARSERETRPQRDFQAMASMPGTNSEPSAVLAPPTVFLSLRNLKLASQRETKSLLPPPESRVRCLS